MHTLMNVTFLGASQSSYAVFYYVFHMLEELEFLVSGIVLGLFAGISPGPLFALIVSETLKYGKTEGMKVAISPLITDTPIVLFALFVLANLMGYNLVIGIISLLGAFFLTYLGIGNFKVKTKESEVSVNEKNSLKRAVVVNFLNPNPYVFWLFVGGPLVFRGFQTSALAAISFLVGFYWLLIGSNVGIALIVEKSKTFVGSKYYIYIVQALGLTLILFASFFVYEGLRLVGLF